jgi:hypothetical protein
MRGLGVAVALGVLLAAPAAGQDPTLVLDLLSGNPPRVAVSVRDLLTRRAFIEALQSGFPLYMEYRVRLRRPQALRDRTIWEDVRELVVVHDPVQDRYTVRTSRSTEIVPDRQALAARLSQVTVLPFDGQPGEYYFDAVVTARMLSDDDVDEAFAWLRGEGADSGPVEDPGLLARLARRVLILVTALQSERLDARTGRFSVP